MDGSLSHTAPQLDSARDGVAVAPGFKAREFDLRDPVVNRMVSAFVEEFGATVEDFRHDCCLACLTCGSLFVCDVPGEGSDLSVFDSAIHRDEGEFVCYDCSGSYTEERLSAQRAIRAGVL